MLPDQSLDCPPSPTTGLMPKSVTISPARAALRGRMRLPRTPTHESEHSDEEGVISPACIIPESSQTSGDDDASSRTSESHDSRADRIEMQSEELGDDRLNNEVPLEPPATESIPSDPPLPASNISTATELATPNAALSPARTIVAPNAETPSSFLNMAQLGDPTSLRETELLGADAPPTQHAALEPLSTAQSSPPRASVRTGAPPPSSNTTGPPTQSVLPDATIDTNAPLVASSEPAAPVSTAEGKGIGEHHTPPLSGAAVTEPFSADSNRENQTSATPHSNLSSPGTTSTPLGPVVSSLNQPISQRPLAILLPDDASRQVFADCGLDRDTFMRACGLDIPFYCLTLESMVLDFLQGFLMLEEASARGDFAALDYLEARGKDLLKLKFEVEPFMAEIKEAQAHMRKLAEARSNRSANEARLTAIESSVNELRQQMELMNQKINALAASADPIRLEIEAADLAPFKSRIARRRLPAPEQ